MQSRPRVLSKVLSKVLPKKIVLKLSGEVFSDSPANTLSREALLRCATMAKTILSEGRCLAIVIGGGNIFRGHELQKECGIDRVSSDLMGMYATLINGLALKGIFLEMGVDVVCFSPATLIGQRLGTQSASLLSYDSAMAQDLFARGIPLLLTGGTGNPFFTTDTAAVLRALELDADIVVKATKVNGAFSEDPMVNPNATRYETIRFQEALENNLQVMDQTAFSLAQEHKIPLFIYKYGEPLSPIDAMKDRQCGTHIVP